MLVAFRFIKKISWHEIIFESFRLTSGILYQKSIARHEMAIVRAKKVGILSQIATF